MLKGKVSARYSPASACVMAVFVLMLWWSVGNWGPADGNLENITQFMAHPLAWLVILALFGIAVFGGMFVVPLYAFLTVTVAANETARTIAVNNIVNSGFMVFASLSLGFLVDLGATIDGTLLYVAFACVVSAGIAHLLHRVGDEA
jgi:hypothetical protein